MLGVWTSVAVRDIEDALQQELEGEFVDYPNGRRSILFGDTPGEAKVRASRFADSDPSYPRIVVHIDARDENRSVDIQHGIAFAAFDAMTRISRDRLELWAEDDTVVRVREAR